MGKSTPALRMAGRKRSHRAKAKREQAFSAWCHKTAANYTAAGSIETGIILRETAAVSSRMARSHLNFLLSGSYEDFT